MVSSKTEIVIKDSCILFDLVDLNLLEDFFRLELYAITTPQVISEITHEAQWGEIVKYIDKGVLKIESNGEMKTINELFDEYPGLSVADCSVLELAIRKQAIIFSSDGSLRKISTRRGFTVRGILWIIEELCNKELINKDRALEALNIYQTVNQRAPIKEIESLTNKILNKKL